MLRLAKILAPPEARGGLDFSFIIIGGDDVEVTAPDQDSYRRWLEWVAPCIHDR
jgi:hypothetical protein